MFPNGHWTKYVRYMGEHVSRIVGREYIKNHRQEVCGGMKLHSLSSLKPSNFIMCKNRFVVITLQLNTGLGTGGMLQGCL